MNVTGAASAPSNNKYGRLMESDITRLPSLNITRVDFYQGSKGTARNGKSNHNWRTNFFTLATFGLTGLYIAHRNNLFNPIRRETRKITRNPEFKEKILTFVKENLNTETFKKATKALLEKISKDKTKRQTLLDETQKILKNNSLMEDLHTKVISNLADDANTERFQRGFASDMLDKLNVRIEKNLRKHKELGLPYKNQAEAVTEAIFTKNTNSPSLAEEILTDVINTRSDTTVDNFLRDSIIKTQLERSVK